MINLDMIGRHARRQALHRRQRHRQHSASDAGQDAAEVRHEGGLFGRFQRRDRATTPRFTSKQVPALFFFSGLHADYHKPSDTWDKIDAPASGQAAGAGGGRGAGSARHHGAAGVRESGGARGGHGGDPSAAPVSGYGPYFGSVPEFGEGTVGVKFADVRENSPAAKAGFKAGDVMVEFDGKPITNLQDFTYVLQGKKPGDEVLVKVMRQRFAGRSQGRRSPAATSSARATLASRALL